MGWMLGLYSVYIALLIVFITGMRFSRQAAEPGSFGKLSLAGFALGSGSVILAIGTAVYAQVAGGFRHYAPALLTIYRIGFLLSLGGLALGIGGMWKRNGLRWHAPMLTLGMLLLWMFWMATE